MTKIVTSDYPLLDEMIRRNIPLTRENYILLDCLGIPSAPHRKKTNQAKAEYGKLQ